MNNKVLILGFGYTAQHLSDLLINHGYSITATSRDPAKIDAWRHSPINLIPFSKQAIESTLETANYLIISTPPNQEGRDPSFLIVREYLKAQTIKPQWIGYLSATSVYGDHKGGWVNEQSPCKTPQNRGMRRAAVEDNWLSLFNKFNLPIHIFRLAGIYGPDRNSLTKILNRKNHSIVKKDQVFSRIHVDDICRALFESMQHPTPGEIYNLADDYPCAPEDVDAYAAQLLNHPPLEQIPYESSNLSPMAKSFYQQCRRVSNEKFKNQFNFQFKYPSYKEGLDSIYKKIKSSS